MTEFKAQNKFKIQISKQNFCHLYFAIWNYFAICTLPFGILCGCQHQHLYKESRIAMGTFVEVASADERAAKIVFNEIARVESLLSKYNPDSEIFRLNKSGQVKASPETFFIIQKSLEFWKVSEGAFDITVGPLLDLWGFTQKQYMVPEDGKIKSMLGLIGSDKIILNIRDSMVKFKLYGMKIDLGAIAKGYAVDCALKKLKAAGIKSCLINAGGQIHCLGDKFGAPWNIAIKNPWQKGFAGYLELKDRAVATSGGYEQYFTKASKRYGHIIDPKTGYPADAGIMSVTVIAPDGLTADALATAIFVLGKTKGEALAQKFPDVEVTIIEERDVQNYS
jgi:thiamine biosynthesis lipoprotein